MAGICPFRALRYDCGVAGPPENLCCPSGAAPSEEARKELLERSPYNAVRLEHPEDGDFGKYAAYRLSEWLENGILRHDTDERLYFYEEEYKFCGVRRTLKGLVARVRLEEFGKGAVMPCEETDEAERDARLSLLCSARCSFSPVLSLYRDESGTVSSLLSRLMPDRPETEFTGNDGIMRRIWPVKAGTASDRICAAFKNVRLHIVNGQPQYEAALMLRDRLQRKNTGPFPDSVMMLLVDLNCPGLTVLPVHRLVRNIPGFDARMVLAGASALFEIERLKDACALPARLAARKRAAAFYVGRGQLFLLSLKDGRDVSRALPDKSRAYCALDTAMLHTLLLGPALGIGQNGKSEKESLFYSSDMNGAMRLVDAGKAQCAFLLEAPAAAQLCDVSLSGERLPKRAAGFYPLPPVGLLMDKMTDLPV